MNIAQEIMDEILNKIKLKNITEKQCLIESKVNTSFFSDWKAGKIKSPSFDKIFRICEYLNISIDRWMKNKTDEN